MPKNEIVYLVVIVNRKGKQQLIKELFECEAKMLNVIYGVGSVKSSEVLTALGLVHERDKAVITCLIKRDDSLKVIELLNTKYRFNEPNAGIAFTIPVEGLKY